MAGQWDQRRLSDDNLTTLPLIYRNLPYHGRDRSANCGFQDQRLLSLICS